MKPFLDFTTKDFVYIAAVTAVVYVVDAITKMTIGSLPIPGIKTILGAVFSMLIIAIGLTWIKKVGSFTLISLIRGIIAGFILPGLPFMAIAIVGGVAGDLVTKLLKGSYDKAKYVVLTCCVYMVVVVPLMNYAMILMGYPEAILTPEVILIITVVCLLITMASSFIGTKIGAELQKAGIL